MNTSRVRVSLLKLIPPLCLGFSIVAMVLSYAKFSNDVALSDLIDAAFVEIYWTAILAVIAFFLWKYPGAASRTAAWVAGIAGFILAVSTNIVPILTAISKNNAPAFAIHDLIALALVLLAWALGIAWSIEALAVSVSSGDWSRTVWAKLRKRNAH